MLYGLYFLLGMYLMAMFIYTIQTRQFMKKISDKLNKELRDATIKPNMIADFKEKHPNAIISHELIPKACAKELGYVDDCVWNYGKTCKECWHREFK